MVNQNFPFAAVLFVCLIHGLHAAGELDANFNPNVIGAVDAVAVAPDGKILVGGSLSSVGGQKSSQIARLLPTGQVDPGWNPAAGKAVQSCAVLGDGTVIAGAWFPGHEGIARLLPDGSSDPAFTASADGLIQGIGVGSDGNLLLAGSFRKINGASRQGFGCLGVDGTLKALPQADGGDTGTVAAIAPRPDGTVFLGGNFSFLEGKAFDRLAKLGRTGLLDDSIRQLSKEVGGSVDCLGIQNNGMIVAGGAFSEVVGGITVYPGLLRFSASGVRDTSFRPVFTRDGGVPRVTSIVIQADGKILAAGYFTAFDGIARQGIVRLLANGTLDRSFNASAAGATGLALQADGKVLVSGTFTQVNGVARNRIARLHNDGIKESLTVRQDSIRWSRDGALPESDLVTFELSTDGGATWSSVGSPRRAATVWTASGLDLPASGIVRARARVTSGILNGSSGLMEKSVSYTLRPEIYVREVAGPDWIYLTDGQSAPIDFGEIPQGDPRVRTIQIYNGGTTSLTVSGIQLPPGFTWLTPPALPASIPTSQYLTVALRADATALGTLGGIARIESDDADEATFDFPLAGVVTGPDIAVRSGGVEVAGEAAAIVFFGGNYQGAVPPTRELVISNEGTKDLAVNSITVPAGFHADPVPALTLPPGGSRVVVVTPDLSAAGWLAGELQIHSSDPDEALSRVRLAAAVLNPLRTEILKPRWKYNRATGHREQTLRILNRTTSVTVPGFRVIIRGLPEGVSVRNASEIRADGSFVIEVLRPLGPLASFDLQIEYLFPAGKPARISPEFSTEVIPALPAARAAAEPEAPFAIARCERRGDGSFLLEFNAVPGRLYQVEHSPDNVAWKTRATTRAAGGKVQWIDPAAGSSDKGFYRVRELAD